MKCSYPAQPWHSTSSAAPFVVAMVGPTVLLDTIKRTREKDANWRLGYLRNVSSEDTVASTVESAGKLDFSYSPLNSGATP